MKLSSKSLGTLLCIPLFLSGCVKSMSAPPTAPPVEYATHLVYLNSHPTEQNTESNRLEFYLSDHGNRLIFEEAGDDFPQYWFSDTTAGQQYFTGPIVDAQMSAEMPPTSPYKNVVGPTIIQLDGPRFPDGGPSDLPKALSQEILTVDPDWLDPAQTEPYTVVVQAFEDDFAESQRRVTIDPTTNQIIRAEKFTVDVHGQEQVYQEIVVETHEKIPLTDLAVDFFTLEGWQRDLPEDHYTIVVDDLD